METMQKEDIIRTIISMPPLDRIEIIDRVYESFDNNNTDENEKLWAEEAERRVTAYLNGEIEAIPLEEVLKEINDMKC